MIFDYRIKSTIPQISLFSLLRLQDLIICVGDVEVVKDDALFGFNSFRE